MPVELGEHLRQHRLADAEGADAPDVLRPEDPARRDVAASAVGAALGLAAAQQGLHGAFPHLLELPGHAGQGDHQGLALPNVEAGRGAGEGNARSAAGDQRLLAVAFAHHPAARVEAGPDELQQVLTVLERPAECLGGRLACQVVLSGSQPPGEHQHRRAARQAGLDSLDHRGEIVGDAQSVSGEDAQIEQPFAQIGLIGVERVAAQQLVAAEDHLAGRARPFGSAKLRVTHWPLAPCVLFS